MSISTKELSEKFNQVITTQTTPIKSIVVSGLPDVKDARENTIYLIPAKVIEELKEFPHVSLYSDYAEVIFVDGKFEMIGELPYIDELPEDEIIEKAEENQKANKKVEERLSSSFATIDKMISDITGGLS